MEIRSGREKEKGVKGERDKEIETSTKVEMFLGITSFL